MKEKRSSLFVTRGVCLMLILAFCVGGCTSGFTTIASKPPKKYEKLGPVSGSASGSLGVLGAAYNFIPMGLNFRVEQAYEEALKSVPGATGLIDVTYQESWFWWIIGTNRTVTISGEAIKEESP
jgi:hypothetical protein